MNRNLRNRLFWLMAAAAPVLFSGCTPHPTPQPPPLPEKISPEAVARFKAAAIPEEQLLAMREEAENTLSGAIREIDEVDAKSDEDQPGPARFDAVVSDFKRKNDPSRREL